MKKGLAIFLGLMYCGTVFSCSTFVMDVNGHHFFGRNYDWITGNGMLMTNHSGINKHSAAKGSTLSWVSKWGSITFNQYGKEFPTGGMNEKGLIVELMWLEQSAYPADDTRPEIDVLQWIQYQLDNCATVEEVIKTDAQIRIGNKGNTPLHFLIADRQGGVATIEFLDGKLELHLGKGLPYPVLTNTSYAASLESLQQGSSTDNSIARFQKGCKLLRAYRDSARDGSPVDYAFKSLDQLEQPGHTKWKIVYDITSLRIYMVIDGAPLRKWVDLQTLSFDCATPERAFKLALNREGNVTPSFTKLDYADNLALIRESAKQSSAVLAIKPEEIEAAARFLNDKICSSQGK